MEIFEKMAKLGAAAFNRQRNEHYMWLDEHRRIIESVPAEVAAAFGKLEVTVSLGNGKTEKWGILLTVGDHLFWKRKIADGVRFKFGVKTVRGRMIEHLAKQIEDATELTPQERKDLLALAA